MSLSFCTSHSPSYPFAVSLPLFPWESNSLAYLNSRLNQASHNLKITYPLHPLLHDLYYHSIICLVFGAERFLDCSFLSSTVFVHTLCLCLFVIFKCILHVVKNDLWVPGKTSLCNSCPTLSNLCLTDNQCIITVQQDFFKLW